MTYDPYIREASLTIMAIEQSYLDTEDLSRIAREYFAAATKNRDDDTWYYIYDLVHFGIEYKLSGGDIVVDHDEHIISIHLEGFDFTIRAPHEDEPGQEHFCIEPAGDYAESLSEEMRNSLTFKIGWDEPVRFFAVLLEHIACLHY